MTVQPPHSNFGAPLPVELALVRGHRAESEHFPEPLFEDHVDGIAECPFTYRALGFYAAREGLT